VKGQAKTGCVGVQSAPKWGAHSLATQALRCSGRARKEMAAVVLETALETHDPLAVVALVRCGVPRPDAIEALEACGNDQTAAIEYIMRAGKKPPAPALVVAPMEPPLRLTVEMHDLPPMQNDPPSMEGDLPGADDLKTEDSKAPPAEDQPRRSKGRWRNGCCTRPRGPASPPSPPGTAAELTPDPEPTAPSPPSTAQITALDSLASPAAPSSSISAAISANLPVRAGGGWGVARQIHTLVSAASAFQASHRRWKSFVHHPFYFRSDCP
jgi:hypothetical protein